MFAIIDKMEFTKPSVLQSYFNLYQTLSKSSVHVFNSRRGKIPKQNDKYLLTCEDVSKMREGMYFTVSNDTVARTKHPQKIIIISVSKGMILSID